MEKPKKVFVGLSGGVDSSVAALRLKKQGYEVVGVFIKVWQPDFLDCNWEAERLDAMRVAAHLQIPFLTCDATQAYKDGVADYFIETYKAGRTPNPDVFCNKEVKFKAFLTFAKEHGADYIATGHYAQNIHKDGTYTLLRGIDTNKDQSYFLWTLTQEQLQHVLLPVGGSTKETIRKEAEAAKLPTATKKDSQGICFLGHVDIKEFLGHYIPLEDGSVLDTKGNVIGVHHGAILYTYGQRHGFTINTTTVEQVPHYVVAKDSTENTITVDTKPHTLEATSIITLTNVQWVGEGLTKGDQVEAQYRYRQKPFTVVVQDVTQDTCVIALQETQNIPAEGQSCVLYVGEKCVGGGIIN